jgi:kynurenine formamidase
MRLLETVLLCSLATACAVDDADRRVVDLTHDFAADTIYWPTAGGFELTVDHQGTTEQGFWYAANTLRAAEHGGTHLDAPAHFAKGQSTTEQVALERLIGPAVVIDVRAACEADRDHQVTVEELTAFETRHGRIERGAIVLLHTGFGRYWPDRERYLGTARRGLEATFELHFPGLHPAAAKWLAVEREVGAVGIDTASIDHGPSRLFLAHRELAQANVPAFENVAGLDRLPPTGAEVVALPMKIRGGSGGPLRIVALLPD